MPLLDYSDSDNFFARLPNAACHWEGGGGPSLFSQRTHCRAILHDDIKSEETSFCETQPIIDFEHATDLAICGVCKCRFMNYSYSSPELLTLEKYLFRLNGMIETKRL
jgi:hypothetical protein